MMIEVAGYIAGNPGRVLLAVAELIPDARAFAFRIPGAFALVSGWLILGQAMSSREIFGCALVFAAITLAQLPEEILGLKKR